MTAPAPAAAPAAFSFPTFEAWLLQQSPGQANTWANLGTQGGPAAVQAAETAAYQQAGQTAYGAWNTAQDAQGQAPALAQASEAGIPQGSTAIPADVAKQISAFTQAQTTRVNSLYGSYGMLGSSNHHAALAKVKALAGQLTGSWTSDMAQITKALGPDYANAGAVYRANPAFIPESMANARKGLNQSIQNLSGTAVSL